jgi:hypothetical protein
MSAYTRKRSLLAWSVALIVLSVAALAAERGRKTSQPETDKNSLSELVAETSLEDPNCRKVRRMLWVEKDGWVVRKTRVCT